MAEPKNCSKRCFEAEIIEISGKALELLKHLRITKKENKNLSSTKLEFVALVSSELFELVLLCKRRILRI